jgi:hypothetical protein
MRDEKGTLQDEIVTSSREYVREEGTTTPPTGTTVREPHEVGPATNQRGRLFDDDGPWSDEKGPISDISGPMRDFIGPFSWHDVPFRAPDSSSTS